MEKWSVCICTTNSCGNENEEAAVLLCCGVLSVFSMLSAPNASVTGLVKDIVLSSNLIKLHGTCYTLMPS
eukprot:10523088-Ditylum_brightwellii.AAC.1